MPNLIRGKWYKKYINCYEDKRDYDFLRRGYSLSKEQLAESFCKKYHVPDISENEKKEIDLYWGQYGIKLPDYDWHRMYYYVTGNHNPAFVPDLVAGLIVYEYYNDRTYETAWRDKNMFDRFLPEVPFPKTVLKKIRGRWLVDNKYYPENDYEYVVDRLYHYAVHEHNYVIIKGSRDTGFGKGVKKYCIDSCQKAADALAEWANSTDFIVQECISQHRTMSAFNSSSTNMIRVYSWRHENSVDVIFATVRAGIEGSVTDVCFVNGEERVNLVGITSDGYFRNEMLNQDGVKIKELDSGVKVPAWEDIIRIVKESHLLIDNFDIIGWDFTVDENGHPVCLEFNISWPGTTLYQYVNGPLWGDKTDEILSFLKDEDNRYNYVPYYMRLK